MAEENKQENIEEKKKAVGQVDSKTSRALPDDKKNNITEAEASQTKQSPKKPGEVEKAKKKKEIQEIKPKENAVVRGVSLNISSKHCFAICKMLKNKTPDKAIEILGDVVKKKKSVPMRGREVAHQKGKGVAGAGFPKNASLEIINLLKQLKANAVVRMIENPVIVVAKADKASRPFRREGRRAKRTHVYLEVQDKTKLKQRKK